VVTFDRRFPDLALRDRALQLLLRSPANASHPEAVHVLFEDVRAVKEDVPVAQ
jgi:hypothetical protein